MPITLFNFIIDEYVDKNQKSDVLLFMNFEALIVINVEQMRAHERPLC